MSRDWFAVYANIIVKPKYRRLSPATRGALVHIWALAGQQIPEATFDRWELEQTLDMDGWDGGAVHLGTPDGKAVIDELVRWGWLDVDGDRLLVHDWDAHQFAATKRARDEFEADRKREWRRRRKETAPSLPPAPPSTNITATQHRQDNTRVPDTSGHVRTLSGPKGGVPIQGTCDDCGADVRDTDPGVVVGPGFIRHVEHPPQWTGAA